MAREVGVGVIGMGWMGQVHSRSYRTMQDRFWDSEIQPRLVICADEVESRAQQCSSRFGFAEYTTDWQKVIDHPGVEVVNVTSPNFLHKRMATAAAEAGKHVFCEKPVGQNPQETAQIAAVAEHAGVLSCVCFNYRWAPLAPYIHRRAAAGDTRRGDAFLCRQRRPQRAGDQRRLRRRPRAVCQRGPRQLRGRPHSERFQVPDGIRGPWHAGSPALGFRAHERTDAPPARRRGREVGQDGFCRIASGSQHPHHERFAPGPAVGLGYDDLKAIEAFQFLQSIHKGEQGEPSLGDALEVARVQAAIIRSLNGGGWEGVSDIP